MEPSREPRRLLTPIDENIPQELKGRPNWVAYRPDKTPVNPKTGKNAKADDPATWGEFAQAVRHREAHKSNGISGVGYEFSVDDPYAGVDLDKCRNPETGEIAPWAWEIIRRLNSYTEVSPSGTGVHIFVVAKLPTGSRRKGQVEMYDSGRYFTMTGHHLKGTPTTIEDRQDELTALHTEIFGQAKKEVPKGPSPAYDLADSELIERARAARNGDKFDRLRSGDTSGHLSASEADLALCSILSFWTQDYSQIDRIFRASGLYRNPGREKKWDRRTAGRTYGAITIGKALAGVTEGYLPPNTSRQEASRPKPEATQQTIGAGKGNGAQAAPLKTTLKTFTARELGTTEFPPQRWAIPNLIPEGLTILGGRPKSGKSWFALNLSVASATGGMALGKIQVEQGEVLYLALEDTPRRLKGRLSIIIPSGDLPDTLHFHTAIDFPQAFKEALDALSSWLEAHPKASLVVIDTLARIKPPKKRNADSYDHDSKVMAALQNLSVLHRIAIIVVAHTKKASEEDFLSNILGSSGLTGVADCVAELTRKARGQMDGVLKLTGRDIQEQELAMRFHSAEGSWELMGDAEECTKSQPRQGIITLLRENGPKTPKEIAEAMGKKPDNIRSLLWKMAKDQEVNALDGNKYEVFER